MPVLTGVMASLGTNSGLSETVQKSRDDFGFASMAKGQGQVLNSKDSQNNTDSVQVPILSKMTQKKVIEWVLENPNEWQQWDKGDTKRKRAESIALGLCGDSSGYKTIERAFDKLNIEL